MGRGGEGSARVDTRRDDAPRKRTHLGFAWVEVQERISMGHVGRRKGRSHRSSTTVLWHYLRACNPREGLVVLGRVLGGGTRTREGMHTRRSPGTATSDTVHCACPPFPRPGPTSKSFTPWPFLRELVHNVDGHRFHPSRGNPDLPFQPAGSIGTRIPFETRRDSPIGPDLFVRLVWRNAPHRAGSKLRWRRSWDPWSCAKGWNTPSTVRASHGSIPWNVRREDGAADVGRCVDSVSESSRAGGGSAVSRRGRQVRADRADVPAREGGPRTRGRAGGTGEGRTVGTFRALGQARVRRARTPRMLGRLRGSVLWSSHGAS
eukprot:scaffold1141_cov333-Pavlova_lutheri.AAC.41